MQVVNTSSQALSRIRTEFFCREAPTGNIGISSVGIESDPARGEECRAGEPYLLTFYL